MTQKNKATRRQFLGTSAGVVAGTALSQMASMPTAYAAASDEINIALIGCGGRGGGAAVDALSVSGGSSKIIAMADAFSDRLNNTHNNLKQQFGDRIDVPEDRRFVGLDAYKQAIDAGPDMVILTTPPGFRPYHFEYAIQRGKHVFMEKPVATDAPGIRKVLAAAEEAKRKNLKVGVGLQRRHEPHYQATVKQLQEGALGHIALMRAYWNGNTPWVRRRADLLKQKPDLTEMEYQVRNWYFFNWVCGDHIVEQHIHNIDVCNWIKGGPPAYAQGQGGRQVRTGKDHGEIYDHHFVEFTYADGSVLLSQCRHMGNCWNQVAEFAHSSTGMSHVGAARINFRDGKVWRYDGQRRNGYRQEHQDLADAIRNNTPYNEAEYGATSTMTAILGRMTTYSGQLIKWDDAINSEHSLMPEKFAWDAQPPVLPNEEGYYPIPTPGVTKVL